MVSPLRRPGTLISAAVLVVAVTAALAPGLFTAADPLADDLAERLRPPGAGHPFGTDELGRDLLARVAHGSAASLSAAVVAVGIAVLAGSVLGLVAGTARGVLDDMVMRAVEVLLAVPSFLLVLIVVAVLGPGTGPVAIAVGVSATAVFARITRAEVIRVRGAGYVEAAAVSGTGRRATLVTHVLPNAAGPVAALAALELGNAILTVAAVGFLGFGAPPPDPEWGSLIAAGRQFLASAWWLTTLPGLVIVAVVLAVNHLGHTLRSENR
ncbi:ABC transporter permease [Amycolatopsis sp. EV170708-02-1]|uniref:ABC transporter permease n=1 Tax=Amycolatopsis sp. EV170708-02-1 TaxID=2919322 RepID=UPI001F0CCB3B|nr:ABC transporter permease [Amycolatopsis sp. EV170708-02-1]UMP06909.1 ABC transporter permease [Amycolatopsis sp. EV170708-02-1]